MLFSVLDPPWCVWLLPLSRVLAKAPSRSGTQAPLGFGLMSGVSRGELINVLFRKRSLLQVVASCILHLAGCVLFQELPPYSADVLIAASSQLQTSFVKSDTYSRQPGNYTAKATSFWICVGLLQFLFLHDPAECNNGDE
jgi:hypothetical protein